jgi:hypothetical protein
MLPQGGEVVVEEDSVVNLDQEEYRSLRMMLQCSVWYTVWARSLADLETPNGFVNLVRVVNLGLLAGA